MRPLFLIPMLASACASDTALEVGHDAGDAGDAATGSARGGLITIAQARQVGAVPIGGAWTGAAVSVRWIDPATEPAPLASFEDEHDGCRIVRHPAGAPPATT